MTEIYKVVREHNGQLVSAVIPDGNKYCTVYEVGEWTYPKEGVLFSFFTWFDAVEFYLEHAKLLGIVEDRGESHIYSGEAVLASIIPYRLGTISYSLTEEALDAFWKRKINGRWTTFPLVDYPPTGTIFCDSVKLIREEL